MANPLRRTMVYLGLADEDYEYDHQSGPVAPVAPVAHNSAPAPSRGSVTPLRRASNHRGAAAEMNEILTVHPRQYKDAQLIGQTGKVDKDIGDLVRHLVPGFRRQIAALFRGEPLKVLKQLGRRSTGERKKLQHALNDFRQLISGIKPTGA